MEEWMRWEPINGVEGKYFVNLLSLSDDGLVIRLSDWDEKKKIEVIFDGYVDAYRYTNDSFSFKIPAVLSEKYEKGFYKDWSFFKVVNSDYLHWLSEKSSGYADDFPFVHFCIMGGDEIVDILSRYEPEVRIIS